MVGRRLLQLLPFALATLAIAGLVHVATVFAYPRRAEHDAFSRVARLGAVGSRIDLPPADGGPLPSRDPAMATSLCRYDLRTGPFHIAAPALDGPFLSIGLHSRSGVPFYGLNLHATDGAAVDLVLMTEQQKADADASADEVPRGQLRIVAPEPEGFAVIESPLAGASSGRDALAQVNCGAAAG